MTFFLDNNLSKKMAEGMRAFGEDVVHLTDKFAPDTDDEKSLSSIGSRGWFLITKDNRIRYRPNELAALRKYKVGAFFLGGKNRSRFELIQQLIRHWPRIKEFAGQTERPFAFRIPPSGTKFRILPLG